MSCFLQRLLGADWERLPPVLRTHYRDACSIDVGRLNIEYPRALQPVLDLMRLLGALVNRRGRDVATTVVKQAGRDGTLRWQRTLRFAGGRIVRFDSHWAATADGHVIEFVNAVLGLEMAPAVQGRLLVWRGVRFVLRLGRVLLPIPQWLALGTTTIVEEAVDERRYRMDFRMTHPWFGELFSYAGVFEADVGQLLQSAGGK